MVHLALVTYSLACWWFNNSVAIGINADKQLARSATAACRTTAAHGQTRNRYQKRSDGNHTVPRHLKLNAVALTCDTDTDTDT